MTGNYWKLLGAVLGLVLAFGLSSPAHAMSPAQLKKLAGTDLLDLRVDALWQQCGLPTSIQDTAPDTQPRQSLDWNHVQMNLSSQAWEIVYGAPQTETKSAWRNPKLTKNRCLPGLARIVLYAKGEVGILSIQKRDDNLGYLTSYRVPQNLYTAHQVNGFSADLKQGLSIAALQAKYGQADEVQSGAHSKIYRYWVVEIVNQAPVAVHAVDFELEDGKERCTNYRVYNRGTDFVQNKFDALIEEWQKNYVFD